MYGYTCVTLAKPCMWTLANNGIKPFRLANGETREERDGEKEIKILGQHAKILYTVDKPVLTC